MADASVGGNRLRELDGLRGLAALAVVAYHYLNQYPHRFDRSVFTPPGVVFGRFGVQTFFIISGFVIYMTLERVRTPGRFAFARFSRLYPAYWVAMAFTFLAMTISPLADSPVTPRDAVVNLSMLQGFFGVAYVDGAYWSLTVELGFYFVVLLLLAIGQAHRALVVMVGLTLANVALNVSGRWLQVGPVLDAIDSYAKFFREVGLFAAGIAFYQLVRQGRRSWLVYTAIVLAPIAEWLAGDREQGLVAVVIVVIFALVVRYRPPVLSTRLMLYFGSISYTLYLVHQNVGYVIIRFLDSSGGNHWLSVAAAFGFAVGLATLLTRFVERPSQRWMRARFHPRAASPSELGTGGSS